MHPRISVRRLNAIDCYARGGGLTLSPSRSLFPHVHWRAGIHDDDDFCPCCYLRVLLRRISHAAVCRGMTQHLKPSRRVFLIDASPMRRQYPVQTHLLVAAQSCAASPIHRFTE